MQGRTFLLAEAFNRRSIIPELRPTFDGPQIKRELLRKGRSLALCVRTGTDSERVLRVGFSPSAKPAVYDRYLRIGAVHTDRSNPGSLQTDRLCPLTSVIMFTGQLTGTANRL
jgi:hypothetical protein